MSEISIPFPEAIFKAWRFCDESSHRYALQFLRVSFNDRIVEASDGRIAVRHKFSPGRFTGFEDVFFDCVSIERIWNQYKDTIDVHLVFRNGGWYASDDVSRFLIKSCDSKSKDFLWPDIDYVYRLSPKKVCKFSLSLELLGQIYEAYRSSDRETAIEFQVPVDGDVTPVPVSLSLWGETVAIRLQVMSDADGSPPVKIESPQRFNPVVPVVNLQPKAELKWAGDYKP